MALDKVMRNSAGKVIRKTDNNKAAKDCGCCVGACEGITGTRPGVLIMNLSTFTGGWCPAWWGDYDLDSSGTGYDFAAEFLLGEPGHPNVPYYIIGSEDPMSRWCWMWWGDVDCILGATAPSGAYDPTGKDCAWYQDQSDGSGAGYLPSRQCLWCGVVDLRDQAVGQYQVCVGAVTVGNFSSDPTAAYVGPYFTDNPTSPAPFTDWSQLHMNTMTLGGGGASITPWCHSRTAWMTKI